MKSISAIPLDVSARGIDKSGVPKELVAYGKVIAAQREKLELTQQQLAHLAGYKDGLTVTRIENGLEGASAKAAVRLAEALRKKGAALPPLALGDEDWTPPRESAGRPRQDPTEELIRRNLIRFREALGLDQFAAATATGIPYEELRSYELGDATVPPARLAAIAAAYGCRAGDFFEDRMPALDASKVPVIHLGGPATANLTPHERETVERIMKAATERHRPKRRR